MSKEVKIYTDGACSGNPGPGGYGALLICDEHRKEVSGGFRYTTNSRMELQAVIAGLAALKFPCQVTVYADSEYVVKGALEWLPNWLAQGWQTAKGQPVQNIDLWQRMLELIEWQHTVKFVWVKGHVDQGNRLADRLARQAMQQPDLPTDVIYEQASSGVVKR